jgi:transcriptional regulator with XRE-family HTH domain
MPELLFDFSPEELRNRRVALGLTREHIAIRVGRSAQTVEHWELGKTPVPSKMRDALLVALRLDRSMHDLLVRTRAEAGVPPDIEDLDAVTMLAELLRGAT